MKIPIVGGEYEAYSTAENAQKCMNWFPSPDPTSVSNGYVLHPTPGLRTFGEGSGAWRGVNVMDSVPYVVQGNTLYSVASNGAFTSLGAIAGTERVSMSNDGTRLTITTGGIGYQYNAGTNTLAQITDADYVATNRHNRFISGYTVYCGGNGQQFQVSAPYDSGDIDGLDFASAEADPDDLVTLEVNEKLIYFFGKESTEIWQNSGGTFPFTAIQGAFIERGCLAEWSVSKLDGKVFWLADDKNVYYLLGYERFSITPPGIASKILEAANPQNAYAYTYIQGGHAFYCLTFDEFTLCYDLVTQQWHERGSWDGDENQKWKVTHLFDAFQNTYALHEDGNICKLDRNYFYEESNIIVRDRISQDITGEGRRVKQNEMQVLTDPGQGLPNNTIPYLQLRWSDDQGYTWSNEHWKSIGKAGEYKNRAKWNRLGSFLKTRRYWLRSSSPVKSVILDAWGEFS